MGSTSSRTGKRRGESRKRAGGCQRRDSGRVTSGSSTSTQSRANLAAEHCRRADYPGGRKRGAPSNPRITKNAFGIRGTLPQRCASSVRAASQPSETRLRSTEIVFYPYCGALASGAALGSVSSALYRWQGTSG